MPASRPAAVAIVSGPGLGYRHARVMSGERTHRVFISYSHDSPAHQKRVLELANQLRREGVDAWIDRFEPHPALGWPRWMRQQIDGAAFVLAICSPTYRRRFDGEEEQGKGRGVTWEGLLASQMIYETGGQNDRLIPVLFDGGDAVVPTALRPYTRYKLPEQADDLYRRLTSQPEVVPEPLGKKRQLSGKRRKTTKQVPVALPALQGTSPGAPDPGKVESPFIVGPPIEAAEQLSGDPSFTQVWKSRLSALDKLPLGGMTLFWMALLARFAFLLAPA
jgi:hypothetical protein